MAKRIAVIGFGFSGLLVVANLVRNAITGTTIYIIADDLSARGLAYSTTNTQHLLNVPTGKMGAFPDDIEGFLKWQHTPDAALAKQQLHLDKDYTTSDFAPRALYAKYLESVWIETQEIAAQQDIYIKLVEASATAIQRSSELAVLTTRGDAIAVDDIVLATGNETKPVLPQLPVGHVVQNPWTKDAFAGAASWNAPVLLMGVGLTAVDTILALRSNGYTGEIIAFSRNGLLPKAHTPATRIFAFEKDALLTHRTVAEVMQYVRNTIAEQDGEWRVVIDALRPYTQLLWQRFSAIDKQHYLDELLTLWNVHRHRMAPEIAAAMNAEIEQGTTRIVASKTMNAEIRDERLVVNLNGVTLTPSRIINCTGPQLNVEKSSSTLLKQLVADGILESHATGLGIAADPQQRAWGNAHPHVYAMGGLLTGQLLETTAVPELRTQAAQLASDLTA